VAEPVAQGGGVSSPTKRSLDEMRKRCYLCHVVEKWNPFAKVRVDMFGFIDIVCVGNGETVAIQATSGDNVAARVTKIASDELAEKVAEVRKAGWRIIVMGWRKNAAKRWTLREVDVS
jgi:hypothetical protein